MFNKSIMYIKLLHNLDGNSDLRNHVHVRLKYYKDTNIGKVDYKLYTIDIVII